MSPEILSLQYGMPNDVFQVYFKKKIKPSESKYYNKLFLSCYKSFLYYNKFPYIMKHTTTPQECSVALMNSRSYGFTK